MLRSNNDSISGVSRDAVLEAVMYEVLTCEGTGV